MQNIETRDIDLAAAMISKGAELKTVDGSAPFETRIENGLPRVYFKLMNVPSTAFEKYRQGEDGILAFTTSRRFLLQIVKSNQKG